MWLRFSTISLDFNQINQYNQNDQYVIYIIWSHVVRIIGLVTVSFNPAVSYFIWITHSESNSCDTLNLPAACPRPWSIPLALAYGMPYIVFKIMAILARPPIWYRRPGPNGHYFKYDILIFLVQFKVTENHSKGSIRVGQHRFRYALSSHFV